MENTQTFSGDKKPVNPSTNGSQAPAKAPGNNNNNTGNNASAGNNNDANRVQSTANRDQFQRDLSAFVSDVEALVSRGGTLSAEALAASKEQLADKVQTIKSQLSDLGDRASATTNDKLEAAQGYVRERPLQSVGIALGVGAVIGLLLSRR